VVAFTLHKRFTSKMMGLWLLVWLGFSSRRCFRFLNLLVGPTEEPQVLYLVLLGYYQSSIFEVGSTSISEDGSPKCPEEEFCELRLTQADIQSSLPLILPPQKGRGTYWPDYYQPQPFSCSVPRSKAPGTGSLQNSSEIHRGFIAKVFSDDRIVRTGKELPRLREHGKEA
jgi:hypothetical protein